MLMTANAAIVYSQVQNRSTVASSPSDNEVININDNSASEFNLVSQLSKGQTIHLLAQFSPDFDFVGDTSGDHLLARVGSGTSIDPGSAFSSNLNGQAGLWTAGTTDYFGFRFNPSGTQQLYGWARLTISADFTTATLVDWAYEDSGAAIITPVPEPSAVIFSATALVSASFLRRRRA